MNTAVLEKNRAGIKSETEEPEEVMAYCPHCKALQTIWLTGDALMNTAKFTQHGNHIYHNCGATAPCKLYFDRQSS